MTMTTCTDLTESKRIIEGMPDGKEPTIMGHRDNSVNLECQ